MDITHFLFFCYFLAHWTPAVNASSLDNCPQRNVEFLFNIDFSASYYSQRMNLKYNIASIIEGLETNYPGAKFGLASFSDKKTDNIETKKDVCYLTRMKIGEKDGFLDMFRQLLSVKEHGGMNPAESQLDALFHGSLSSTVGWSVDNYDLNGIPILRVMILMTDGFYSKAGEAKKALGRHYIYHDGRHEPSCEELDYPTVPMVRDAMITAGVVPMLITTQSRIRMTYEELLEEMNVGGKVIQERAATPGIFYNGLLTSQILEHVQELYCETPLPPLSAINEKASLKKDEGITGGGLPVTLTTDKSDDGVLADDEVKNARRRRRSIAATGEERKAAGRREGKPKDNTDEQKLKTPATLNNDNTKSPSLPPNDLAGDKRKPENDAPSDAGEPADTGRQEEQSLPSSSTTTVTQKADPADSSIVSDQLKIFSSSTKDAQLEGDSMKANEEAKLADPSAKPQVDSSISYGEGDTKSGPFLASPSTTTVTPEADPDDSSQIQSELKSLSHSTKDADAKNPDGESPVFRKNNIGTREESLTDRIVYDASETENTNLRSASSTTPAVNIAEAKPAAPSQIGEEDQNPEQSLASSLTTSTVTPKAISADSSQIVSEEADSSSSFTDADQKKPNGESSVSSNEDVETPEAKDKTKPEAAAPSQNRYEELPENENSNLRGSSSTTTPPVKVAEANPAAPSHIGDEESENSLTLTDADGKEETKKSNVAAIAAAGGGVGALALVAAGYATYAAKGVQSIPMNDDDGFGDQIHDDGDAEVYADFDGNDYA